jgi:Icc-related predicted phosphoesterase
MAPDLRGYYAESLAALPDEADVLLVAGDLTQHGTLDEAAVFADDFGECGVPVVVVLGNHDYHSNVETGIRELLEDAGIRVLEGDSAVVKTPAGSVGIAGAKGFCMGFAGRCAANFGEPEMKVFTDAGVQSAERLRKAFSSLPEVDVKVALTHFAPIDDTLAGEPPEIWPFLGNYLLGEVIDASRAHLAVHGHAHAGTERGETAAGIPVRNVAQPVIRRAYQVYEVRVGA